MGKTGSVNWIQVKGVKGQIRLVPSKEGGYKKPGPNQRFKSGSKLKKADSGTMERGRGGGRPRRGGRSRGQEIDRRVRRRVKRPARFVMGAKGRR